ncbi:GtrA family protein [Methylocystis sp. S23]|jgi:putative flippase GtrA
MKDEAIPPGRSFKERGFVGPWRALAPRIDARILKFLLVGGVNTLFNYAAFLIVLGLTGHVVFSLAISWILGVLFNFRTTGRLVFGSSDPRLLMRFVGVYFGLFWINAAGLRALEWAGLAPALGAMALTPFIAAMSYALMRDFVFSAVAAQAQR